jgi:glycosyltransferase involved in cell wall biosynthesis
MLVSILIPCFNAQQWIGQAIDSALAQNWPHKEVIVIDDGSTDGSARIIEQFRGRIRWEQQENRGSNPTRNRLMAMASGSWLQFLDADDYLLVHKVRRQAEWLATNDDVDVVFGPITLEQVDNGHARREVLPIPQPHDPWVLLARWYLPQTGAPLWRKSAIEDVGGWAPSQPACQEHELYLRLLIAGKRFQYLDETGAVYRQWSEQTLWKADQPRTRRLRLEIEDRAEAILRERQQLTRERHWAINMARFETARSAWHDDRAEARAIAARIRASMPDFMPSGDAAPPRYRRLYRWLGFAATETVASWTRRPRVLPDTSQTF